MSGMAAGGAGLGVIGAGVTGGGALAGDRGKIKYRYKWPGLGTSTISGLTTAEANKRASDEALNEFISRYLANYVSTKLYNQQESDVVGQFYNGQMENRMAQLRAGESAARRAVLDNRSAVERRGVYGGLLGREGGGSSWADRAWTGATTPYRLQDTLDMAAQERADLNYLTQNRLGLRGARAKSDAELAAYGLVPENIRQQYYANYLGNLGALSNLFNQNTYAEYVPSTTEIIGGSLSQAGSSMMGGSGSASAYSGPGMMSGTANDGAPPQAQRPYAEYQGTWSPYGYSAQPVWGVPMTESARSTGWQPADWSTVTGGGGVSYNQSGSMAPTELYGGANSWLGEKYGWGA